MISLRVWMISRRVEDINQMQSKLFVSLPFKISVTLNIMLMCASDFSGRYGLSLIVLLFTRKTYSIFRTWTRSLTEHYRVFILATLISFIMRSNMTIPLVTCVRLFCYCTRISTDFTSISDRTCSWVGILPHYNPCWLARKSGC